MTRCNIGISPCELADLHVSSEIHEVERVFSYAYTNIHRLDMLPQEPRLNEGHIKFSARYWEDVKVRYIYLVEEAKYRGISGWAAFGERVLATHPLFSAPFTSYRLSYSQLQAGRKILKERIITRVSKFRQQDKRWTGRTPPHWILHAIGG